MLDAKWAAVSVSLVGGGLAGSVLTNIVASYRSRKQVIRYRVDVTPVFTGRLLEADSSLWGSFYINDPTVAHGGEAIPNLSIAKVLVQNSGNKDYKDFRFGVTLSEGDEAVRCVIATRDRHHPWKLLTNVSPGAHSSELDFELAVFNRGDLCVVTLYLVASDTSCRPREIALSSPEPIVFRTGPSSAAIVFKALSGATPLVGAAIVAATRGFNEFDD